MNKITLKGLDQDVYFEQLDNGLKVYLVPFENKNSYYLNYYTNYGGEDIEFIPNGKKQMITSPLGIAHFIEHQMFEVEEGDTPFQFYGKSGTSCNAATNYDSTQYEVEGTENLLENLDFLINYVNTPYFTEQSVEKEKGIIIEEIRMYDDDPEWILVNAINKATFKVHPMKYDLAGTKESVANTKKEELYECYNTFYAPNNMALFVGGNFNVDEVMDVIKNNEILKARKKSPAIKRKQHDEPEQVVTKEQTITAKQLLIPRIGYVIKTKIDKLNNIERLKLDLYINIILQKAFGSTSDFPEEMLKKKYMIDLSYYDFQVENYQIINIICETQKPKELTKEIDKRLKEIEITEEDLERYKKVLIASLVRSTDNVSSTINSLVSDIIDYEEIIANKVDIIKNITLKDIKKAKEQINLNNKAVITVMPETKE